MKTVSIFVLWCCILITRITVTVSYPSIPPYRASSYRMPEICLGKAFCTNQGDFYPQDQVDYVIEKYKRIQQRYGEVGEYESRSAFAPREPECTTNRTEGNGLTPVYYLEVDNKTRVVVNSVIHNIAQKHDLKWCAKEGPTLETKHFRKMTLERLKNKFTMMCQTVLTPFTFMVLTPNVSAIEFVTVDMPVLCKARYSEKR